MARKSRIQYPGAVCHVMSRGGCRESLFQDGEDREQFLVVLGDGEVSFDVRPRGAWRLKRTAGPRSECGPAA